MKRPKRGGFAALGGLGLAAIMATGLGLQTSAASSHREAPLITEDPVADNTDTYAFVSPDRPDSITVVANWIPLEEPAGGPNFHKFGDDVLYEINLNLDGDARDDLTYQFRFKTQITNPDTFLYNSGPISSLDDPNWNMRQTYSVTQIFDGNKAVLGEDLVVPPANIGPRSTPTYEQNLGSKAVYDLPTGSGDVRVFAGPRKDPFFVDLGSVFDLAGLRPLNQAHLIPLPNAPGVDNVKRYNVHAVVVQIPIALIEQFKRHYGIGDTVAGVYSTTYRRSTRVLGHEGSDPAHYGRWVEVSRLGMPLVNEVVIPLGQKDKFNASEPEDDAQFGQFVLDPEPSRLIPVLYPGVNVPPAPRADIAAIFLTGIDGVNKPDNVQPAEMIRLNYAIKPTQTDPNKQNRLGLLAGDNDGFPNGRRLVDDVVDIELRALAGGTPFTPEFNKAPNNILTDGVDRSDVPFLSNFPYVAPPIQGYESR
ncbi:MAG: hypothetical protein QOJ19_344 [Acidimicrobiia bacterium]|jgi:hypothetical protein|nr:hypothetical protein [Acidimicrobiia bacterium]